MRRRHGPLVAAVAVLSIGLVTCTSDDDEGKTITTAPLDTGGERTEDKVTTTEDAMAATTRPRPTATVGPEPTQQGMTEEVWTSEANSLCSDAYDIYRSLDEPDSDEDFALVEKQVAGVLSDVTTRLASLEAPATASGDVASVVDALDRYSSVSSELGDAYLASNTQKVIALGNELTPIGDEVVTLAERLGADECARLGGI